MAGGRRRRRHARNSERWISRNVGNVQLRIRVRPRWQAGAPTAQAFAHNLNEAREFGQQIRDGWYPAGRWRLRRTWYSAWRAADAVLRPTLRGGVLARSPAFLAPETERRFERFAKANPVVFAVRDVGSDDARQLVVYMLFEFFESRARDRLKRCQACPTWFADETKNRTQRWCSTKCHARGWSRAARRAAGHAQYTQKGGRR